MSQASPALTLSVGPDPSVGKSAEVFGVKATRDQAMLSSFGVPGLTQDAQVRLGDQTLDATALPGTLIASSEEIAASRLAESLESMARGQLVGQTGLPLGGQLNTGWKYNKRNTLSTIKMQGDLEDRIATLQSGSHRVLEQVLANLTLVIHHGGYQYPDAERLASTSLFYRISQDAQAAFIGLHLYFLTVSLRQGFTYALKEIKHHAKKLKSMQDLYSSGLQVIMHHYGYLRDLQVSKWQTFAIQGLRLETLTSQLQGLTADGIEAGDDTNTAAPNPTCSHCKLTLHLGGKRECYWQSKTSKEARTATKKVAQNLAQLIPDAE